LLQRRMIMKFLLSASIAVIALFAHNSYAQTCNPTPDCSALGYTKTASDCSGKTYTVCPFDTTKYSCDTTSCEDLGFNLSTEDCAGLYTLTCPSDNSKVFCDKVKPAVTCAVGKIVYDDSKCYDGRPSLHEGRTPIGVVFDPVNKFAIGLKDNSSSIQWYPELNPSLPRVYTVTNADDAMASSTTGEGAYRSFFNSGNTYSSCTAASYATCACSIYTYAGKVSWFLPSVRDFVIISQNKTAIGNALTLAGGDSLSSQYWTSVSAGPESGGGYAAWTYYFSGESGVMAFPYTNYSKVRCMVQY